MIHHWQTLTAPQLAEFAQCDPVAVLVLGAIEQHGTHLPLATDLTIGEGLQAAMLEKLDTYLNVICLPPIAVGASDEHTSFPGTLSLPAPLAVATLEAYGESLARAGIRRLVLLNSHGGNKAVMDLAGLTLRRRHSMRVVKTTYTRLPPLEGAIALRLTRRAARNRDDAPFNARAGAVGGLSGHPTCSAPRRCISERRRCCSFCLAGGRLKHPRSGGGCQPSQRGTR